MGNEKTLETLHKLVTDWGNEIDAKIAVLSRRLARLEHSKVDEDEHDIPKVLTVLLTLGAVIYLVYLVSILIKEFRNDLKMP
jgi:hypothetical protein